MSDMLSNEGLNIPQNDAGFSVLEAMVAMAVLAAGLLPILALQGQFVKTVTQIEHVQHSLAAQENALNTIRTIDLIQAPQGEVKFDGYSVIYNAVPTLNSQRAKVNGGLPGRFEVTLYNIEFEIKYLSGRQEKFTVRGIRWSEDSTYLDSF